MSHTDLIELTESEIDFVAGGQPVFTGGLVNLNLSNNQVAVPITAAVDVAANVLGRQQVVSDTTATAPGQIINRP